MKLLSLDEDISSRLVHPQFSHRRLGSKLDQLGVRNFRDALQLPIQDYKEDAPMLKRQQVYQSRLVSDTFAKVLELLLQGFQNTIIGLSRTSCTIVGEGNNLHSLVK